MSDAYVAPPEGWQTFGFHAPLDSVPRLSFSAERGEDGLPLFEQHMYDDAHACGPCRATAQSAPHEVEPPAAS